MSTDVPRLFPELPGALASVEPMQLIAGFWRRLLAFVIDAALTAVPCGVLGFAFYDFFSRSRVGGLLVGIAITLPYFGILGSSVGGGRTLGHRITHIRVVDGGGQLLPVKRSIVRYLILLIPLLWKDAGIPNRFPAVLLALSVALSAAYLAVIYLYLFNVRTRQSLHDLAVGAYVVEAPGSGRVNSPSFWKWHWAILGGIVFAGVMLGLVLNGGLAMLKPFPELMRVQRALLDSGKVQSGGVVLQRNWMNGQTETGIRLEVVWRGTPRDYEQAGRELAAVVLRADPEAKQRDFIAVAFLEGFNIGFATFSNTKVVSHPPEEWARRIRDSGPERL